MIFFCIAKIGTNHEETKSAKTDCAGCFAKGFVKQSKGSKKGKENKKGKKFFLPFLLSLPFLLPLCLWRLAPG
jgi:hypothetical protein